MTNFLDCGSIMFFFFRFAVAESGRTDFLIIVDGARILGCVVEDVDPIAMATSP